MMKVGDATWPRTAEPVADALRERGLARAERAGEHHEVPGAQHGRERTPVRAGRVGVGQRAAQLDRFVGRDRPDPGLRSLSRPLPRPSPT